jgi:hypothetical protein
LKTAPGSDCFLDTEIAAQSAAPACHLPLGLQSLIDFDLYEFHSSSEIPYIRSGCDSLPFQFIIGDVSGLLHYQLAYEGQNQITVSILSL